MTEATHAQVDLDRLLRLRLVVARYGEMDLARWWNSQGMLGRRGSVVLKRGFPATHFFAQARVVFAVATARCQEVWAPAACMTLWNLPAELEDSFEDRWQTWLDERNEWAPLFEQLAQIANTNRPLLEVLASFKLITEDHVASIGKLRRSAESRAVSLAGTHSPSDDVITLLAAGFARGEVGRPAVPYARLED